MMTMPDGRGDRLFFAGIGLWLAATVALLVVGLRATVAEPGDREAISGLVCLVTSPATGLLFLGVLAWMSLLAGREKPSYELNRLVQLKKEGALPQRSPKERSRALRAKPKVSVAERPSEHVSEKPLDSALDRLLKQKRRRAWLPRGTRASAG